MKKLLIFNVVLVMVLGISGVVVGSGQQAQEQGAMFQMWDLAPANLEVYENPVMAGKYIETVTVPANEIEGVLSVNTF